MKRLKALLLTEGMHGMISQAEGMAKALNAEYDHKIVRLSFPWNLIPPKFSPISGIVLKDKAYIRKYDALTEYGGWGIKGGKFWKKDKGTAVNVSGDIGIQLELKSGKKLLIGTQLKNESEMVLQTYKTKLNNDG